MCGMAGALRVTSASPLSDEQLWAMVASLRHRGPDDLGSYVDDDVALGHARLSIIDIEGGRQPVHNEDRTIWVVFNGEIFNYIELREELLRQGHRFYTRSDTEVIVHAYEQHGLDFVQRLNGQFAIALWDSREKRLVLARDRVGIRPLFYAEAAGRLLFASEIKALLAFPGLDARLDARALAETFTFWAPLPGHTLFQGIRSLPPGHVMTATPRRGATSPVQYWDWSFPQEPSDEGRSTDSWAEELRSLLVDAVRLQLRADVPVGAYLSGGLDSSVTTALIKNYTGSPLRTFSVRFDRPEFDETPFQDSVVSALGTRHTAVLCRTTDIGEHFPRAVWHAEAPVLRTAPVPLMLLAAKVREEGYKVVLTGEGADEVLGGYDLFKEARIRRFWARQPGSSIRPRLLQRLYPYLPRSPVATPSYARQFFGQGLEEKDLPWFGHAPRWSSTRRIWKFFHRDLSDALAGYDPVSSVRELLPEGFAAWPPLCRDQYLEARLLMSEYLLAAQGDRVAMAHSVEGRFPFLDHRVIEFGNRLPPRYKLMGLKEKFLLRRAVRDLLPAATVERPKQPYRAPDAPSFFRNGRPLDYVAELLGEERVKDAGLFDPVLVGRLVEKCRRGEAIGFADNMAFVGVLSTMLLHEQFVRRRPAPDRRGMAAPDPRSAASIA